MDVRAQRVIAALGDWGFRRCLGQAIYKGSTGASWPVGCKYACLLESVQNKAKWWGGGCVAAVRGNSYSGAASSRGQR